MANNKQTQTKQNINAFKKIFLLAVWSLVKIGEFGIEFIKFNWSLISCILLFPFKSILSINLNVRAYLQNLLSKKLNKNRFGFLFNKKTRGRPSKNPFFFRYFSQPQKITLKLLPSKLRIAGLILILFVLFFSYSISLVFIAHELPSPKTLSKSNTPITTQIFDRNGELLYRIYDEKNRSLVKLDELPPDLLNATIAIEDKNFWGHPGVDLYGVTRAAMIFFEGGQLQGGSTLTQQLIKNTLLTPERTWQRKVKEVILAFWAERVFSKKDILQMYFNEAPYGGPAWGIAAAAQTYFDKKPQDLTLSESAYLAGLPVSPTTYSPYGSNPELAKERQGEVLRRMVEDKYISQEEADQAFIAPLNIKPPQEEFQAAHFVMYVRSLLSKKYGEKMVSQGGLQVTTTLDLAIQNKAEEVVAEEVMKLAPLKVSNGAAMVTDAKSGHILAMVGSKNYWDEKEGKFNVTTSLRQPGSSIKPLTYAAAFKDGLSPATIVMDTPTSYKNAWENYSPVNYDGRFHGPVTIRTALGSSYNIPAVKVLNEVGIDKFLQTSKDMGITTFTTPDRYGLSITLGGAEIKMVDMMTAYGTFSQSGKRFDSQPILRITDAQGNILEDNTTSDGKKVLPSGIAYMINSILSDNIARSPAFGPNSLLVIPGHTVAVKTGTTDSKRDNWTFGYTPEFVVGTWVGNNNNSPMDPQLTSGITGASPIWHKIMKSLLENKPDIAFTKPDDITETIVNGRKDIVLTGSMLNQGNLGIRSYLSKENKIKDNQPDGAANLSFTDPIKTYNTNSSR